ncbi:MAG: TSUP family transporter, partial [Rhabdochlamydiaceae bacterium]
LLQSAGFRKPIKREAVAGAPLGLGIGLLYSITTISGPPIALFWNNQGMKKQEFKAAVAQVRIAESYLTCISYYFLGLFTVTTFQLFSVAAPPILVGIPLGILIVRKIQLETFRRICMAFDAGVVAYGLSQVFITLFKETPIASYSFFGVVVAFDLFLLYRFLKNRPISEPVPLTATSQKQFESSRG